MPYASLCNSSLAKKIWAFLLADIPIFAVLYKATTTFSETNLTSDNRSTDEQILV